MITSKKQGIAFRYACTAALALFLSFAGKAQESADKIISVIGRNRIILKSDLEVAIAQERQQIPNFTDSMRCLLLQQMVQSKMMAEQADRDSVVVSDEDVDGQLDNKLRYFIQLYGSKEKLEQLSGKTMYQIKEENRDIIREQMMVDKVRGQVLESVKITPAEVEKFYKKIPADSLPLFPATVEVGQIVIDPQVTREMTDYAFEKISNIRKQVTEEGKDFEGAATMNSDDPGSRDNGGKYDGITRTGPMAPEFLAAAFRLQNGEVSPVFKTKFGYHIIKMISRRGDEADISHILIRPEVTSGDFKAALARLDSIHTALVQKKLTFNEAVGKFSTDEMAKRTGGMIADPNTGNTILDITKLDAGMVLLLDSLKPGDFSEPHIFLNDAHEKSCRIVFLRSRTAPHKANLSEDYNKIEEVALAQKKSMMLDKYITNKTKSIYVKIAPEYTACPCFRNWEIVNNNGSAYGK